MFKPDAPAGPNFLKHPSQNAAKDLEPSPFGKGVLGMSACQPGELTEGE